MKWLPVAFFCLGLLAAWSSVCSQTYETRGDIVVDDAWERIASDARNTAFVDQEPELEFEAVLAFMKDYVDGQRASATQQVRFSNPEKFKMWLTNVSRRVGGSREELLNKIIGAVAPNRCPDLTGEAEDSSDYYRNRARDAMRNRTPQVVDSPDDAEDVPDDSRPAAVRRRTARQTPRPVYSPGTGDPSLIRIEDVDVQTTPSKAKPVARSTGKPKARPVSSGRSR